MLNLVIGSGIPKPWRKTSLSKRSVLSTWGVSGETLKFITSSCDLKYSPSKISNWYLKTSQNVKKYPSMTLTRCFFVMLLLIVLFYTFWLRHFGRFRGFGFLVLLFPVPVLCFVLFLVVCVRFVVCCVLFCVCVCVCFCFIPGFIFIVWIPDLGFLAFDSWFGIPSFRFLVWDS